MAAIDQTINTTTIIVVVISEKRCGCYAHLCQDEYKMRLKWPIYNKHEGKNPKSPKHNPRRWSVIKFAAPRWLVDQSASRGHNFCIRSSIWVLDIPLERSIRDLHILNGACYYPLEAIWSPESPKNIVSRLKTIQEFGTRKPIEK